MIAGLQGLIMLAFRPKMTSNILRAMDALAAAQIGYSGRETISKECGREILAGNPCVFCIRICKGLSLIEEMHCEKEAIK